MPFDPNLPQEGTPVDAAEMRAQLNGLKEVIDALQAQVISQQIMLESLQSQIVGCATNPAYVGELTFEGENPPTQWEVGTLRNKLNELIVATKRPGS